jgi:hypothetical protein
VDGRAPSAGTGFRRDLPRLSPLPGSRRRERPRLERGLGATRGVSYVRSEGAFALHAIGPPANRQRGFLATGSPNPASATPANPSRAPARGVGGSVEGADVILLFMVSSLLRSARAGASPFALKGRAKSGAPLGLFSLRGCVVRGCGTHALVTNSGIEPVNTRWASRYFSRVVRTTPSGRRGAGGLLFHPVDSSQSRTNCLSKEAGLLPGV